MGFFPKLDREGPGFDPNAPRKTGFARFGELVSRDTSNLFRAGFLALVGCLPFLVGIAFAISSHVLLFAPVIGLVGGALAGPGLCGLADTVLRSLRDQPSMWWDVYREAWKRSAGASLLPGAVGGVLLGTQIFLLFHAGALQLDTWTGSALAAGILLVLAISLYLWPQMALMELSFPQLVKNSALLFIGQLPRSVAALAILTVYLAAAVWATLRFLILAAVLVPLVNLWLPVLAVLLLVYPGINENFQIEEKLRGK